MFFRCRSNTSIGLFANQNHHISGNKTPDVDYLNSLLYKHMPAGQRVAVDSTPSLHGIWDTINATRASDNPRFRLPRTFYDARTLGIIEWIVLEEEFVGYKESKEYRTLGIGALLGELVPSMRDSIQGECSTQVEAMQDVLSEKYATL